MSLSQEKEYFHPSVFQLLTAVDAKWGPGTYSRLGDTMNGMPVYLRIRTHNQKHYGQFRNTNLARLALACGKTTQDTRTTCKLHKQSGGGIQTSSNGVVSQNTDPRSPCNISTLMGFLLWYLESISKKVTKRGHETYSMNNWSRVHAKPLGGVLL